MIQKDSIVYELPIIVFRNKIYSTSMTSLCIIIQHHKINQCTWLLGKKPIHKQELIPSLKINTPKEDVLISILDMTGSILVNFSIFFLDQIHISRAGLEPATNGLQYYSNQSTALPTELSRDLLLVVIKFIINF